jgi:tetratricopeptide (TPR) repeat protein
VLESLSNRYWQLSRWDDAERCLKREIKFSPEFKTYDRLSNLYKKQGKRELWRATLDEYLQEHESFGLEHARIQVRIADDLMAHREPEQALPYAVAAAETYAAWALLCAHRCYDALEDWENAKNKGEDSAELERIYLTLETEHNRRVKNKIPH